MKKDFSPQHWQWVRLGDIAEIIGGTTPSTTNPEYWDGECPWITPAEINNDSKIIYQTKRQITQKAVKDKSLRILPIGTILLSSRAPIGKVAIVGSEMYCNQGFKNLVCDEKKIYNLYLFYFLKGKTTFLNSLGRGTTFKEISKSIVEKIEIPLPPLEIQREIVEILESKLEKIASAKAILESSLKECETYRLSLLNDAFNGNLTPHSKDWQWVNIQSVCKKIIAGGDKPLSFSQEKTQTHNIPIYANAIKDNGLYGWTTESVIQEPAITISARGTIGFICPRFEPFFPIVRLLVAIPNEKIDLLFLSYALKHILPSGNGSSIPQLTIPKFKQLSIPLPPLEIQREIVEILESKLEKIVSTKALLESSLQECETYRLSLLESAFRGELV